MKRQSEFLDALLRGAGPSLELLGAFALGLLMVGILSNLAYDLLVAPQEVWATTWRPVGLVLLLTGAAYFLYRQDRGRRRTIVVSVDESRRAPPYPGLIWLLGPQIDHLLFALAHHQQGSGAAHCWLVMQSNYKPVQKAYEQLSSQVSDRGWQTRLHPVYISQVDAQSAYEAVRTVFSREAAEEELTPEEVIADITSGTKPLTAGLILAALTVNGALEYVESDRDEQGQVIQGSQRVVLVDTKFHLSREHEAQK
jgi:hypothetical protein